MVNIQKLSLALIIILGSCLCREKYLFDISDEALGEPNISYIPYKKDKNVEREVDEDAAYISERTAMLSDGVGGWNFPSSHMSKLIVNTLASSVVSNMDTNGQIDDGSFSRFLVSPLFNLIKSYNKVAQKSLKLSLSNFSKKKNIKAVAKALNKMKKMNERSKVSELGGAGTLLGCYLKDSITNKPVLHILKAGDSLLTMMKKVSVTENSFYYTAAFITDDMQKAFNTPAQLSSYDSLRIKLRMENKNYEVDDTQLEYLYGEELKKELLEYEIPIETSDIVLMASDGLYDNISAPLLIIFINYILKHLENLSKEGVKKVDKPEELLYDLIDEIHDMNFFTDETYANLLAIQDLRSSFYKLQYSILKDSYDPNSLLEDRLSSVNSVISNMKKKLRSRSEKTSQIDHINFLLDSNHNVIRMNTPDMTEIIASRSAVDEAKDYCWYDSIDISKPKFLTRFVSRKAELDIEYSTMAALKEKIDNLEEFLGIDPFSSETNNLIDIEDESVSEIETSFFYNNKNDISQAENNLMISANEKEEGELTDSDLMDLEITTSSHMAQNTQNMTKGSQSEMNEDQNDRSNNYNTDGSTQLSGSGILLREHKIDEKYLGKRSPLDHLNISDSNDVAKRRMVQTIHKDADGVSNLSNHVEDIVDNQYDHQYAPNILLGTQTNINGGNETDKSIILNEEALQPQNISPTYTPVGTDEENNIKFELEKESVPSKENITVDVKPPNKNKEKKIIRFFDGLDCNLTDLMDYPIETNIRGINKIEHSKCLKNALAKLTVERNYLPDFGYGVLSKALASGTKYMYEKKNWNITPFAIRASLFGKREMGEKPDDVTVMVTMIKKAVKFSESRSIENARLKKNINAVYRDIEIDVMNYMQNFLKIKKYINDMIVI